MSQKVNLKELDFNNIGNWLQKVKVVFCVLLVLFIVIMVWFVLISGKCEELGMLEQCEFELCVEFEKEQGCVVNLELFKQQLIQMEQVLQQMLCQLLSKIEMLDLIIDILQIVLFSGLFNELFQFGVEVFKEFYVEKLIVLCMVGSYYQFGVFVSGVVLLLCVVILIMYDINLKFKDFKIGIIVCSGVLELFGMVKIYCYLDDVEMEVQEKVVIEKDKVVKVGGK